MPSKQQEEEFVYTISDNEGSLGSDAESQSSKDIPQTRGIKRKREDVQQGANKKTPAKTRRLHDAASEEEDSENRRELQDGMMDSDFEFDLGVSGNLHTVEDFDGWGDDNGKHSTNGIRKAADVDDIIARRAAKRGEREASEKADEQAEQTGSESDSEAGNGVVSGSEVDSDVEMDMPDFEDDELLATDTFGGNVVSEDEDSEHSVQADDEDRLNASESDNDSIASPTAHPDDLVSGNEDDSTSQTSASDDEEAAKRAAFFAPESQPEPGTNTSNSFQQFSLSRPILRALAALSFNNPTPIQTRTIPMALQGLDIVGSAVTGSGKTAAFLLPILERLLYRPRKIPTTRVAVLMPTRELAVQCYNVATALARYTDITFAQVVGGFSLREQEAILKKRPDVVIATPGRFIDHMRNSASFVIENLEILVLDEADRMLEDGFADELDEILRTIPKGRQTMLFSATMTETVDKLVRVGMNRPIRVSVDAKKSTVSGLVQEFVRLRPGREEVRLATLCVLCTNVFTERTIIFLRQKKEAHRVRIVFGLLGIKAGELHGSMSQEQRITAVNGFREGKTTHLLATDLASRGLDIKNVMSVINYEAPQSHEIYLHRVGRTARAGKSGRACTIAAEPDRKVVKAAVKAGRSQGAKIVSRTVDIKEVDAMHAKVEGFAEEIEEIMQEEKAEKALSQAETQITRGENLVKHEAEIMARPKRTWFESEKEKKAAQDRGKAELNGGSASGVKFSGEKKKLSNKDKKRLDDRRERLEGKSWKKKKGDGEAVKKARKDKRGRNGGPDAAAGTGGSGRGGGGGGQRRSDGARSKQFRGKPRK